MSKVEKYEAERDRTYPYGWRVKGGTMMYNPKLGDRLESDGKGGWLIVVKRMFSNV